MKSFRPSLALVALLGLLLALAGCVAPPPATPPGTPPPAAIGATETPMTVAFDELIANATRYAGQRVCSEGIAVQGFEANALGAGIRQQGQAVYLTEPTIWIASAEKEVIGECSSPRRGRRYPVLPHPRLWPVRG